MFRQGRFRTWKAPRVCVCTHPALAHYAPDGKRPTNQGRGNCRMCICPLFEEAKRPNKYHSVKQEFGGKRYDSKFEAKVAADLDYQLRAGEIQEIQRQVRIPLLVNGKKICTYICDFKILWKDGTVEYREAKGFRTREYVMKQKLFEALHIDGKTVTFREVTQ